jgi:uncharacterized membrane protein YfcA
MILIPCALAVGLTMGLLGSGGSILTVPILVYLMGQDEKVAIASSLAIVGAVAALTTLFNIRDRSINWRTAIWFGAPGVLGTYLGAALSQFASGQVQLMVFAAVMLLSAFFMFWPPKFKPVSGDQKRLAIVSEGLLIGALTGFVGVPALVLLGGLSMTTAAATSLVIIAVKSAAGLVKYLELMAGSGLGLDWNLILIFIGFGMLGSFLGRVLGRVIEQRRAEQVFSIFLVAIAGWILVQSL